MGSLLSGYLLVFLGGGIGASLRHFVNRLSVVMLEHFPLGTMIINIVGCFAIGMLAAWFTFRGEQSGQHLRLFLTTGILGGFTTFSAFSLDFALLAEKHQYALATAYVLGSVGLSLIAVFAGMSLMRSLIA